MKDGWHIVKGWNVWVENNKILHGTDRNHKITVYPYHSTKYGIVNAVGVSVYTFRNSHKYFMEQYMNICEICKE